MSIGLFDPALRGHTGSAKCRQRAAARSGGIAVKRSESLRRQERGLWCVRSIVGMGLLVYAALHASASHVATVSDEARPPVRKAVALQQTPSFEFSPCARCYVAPAPSAHSFSGESAESAASEWRALHKHADGGEKAFDTEALRALVPLRIAFCRWRN